MGYYGGLIGFNGNFNGIWLVVYTYPSEKYEPVGMMTFPIYGKIKNVPNHQPVFQTTNQCCMIRKGDDGFLKISGDTASDSRMFQSNPYGSRQTRIYKHRFV